MSPNLQSVNEKKFRKIELNSIVSRKVQAAKNQTNSFTADTEKEVIVLGYLHAYPHALVFGAAVQI